MNGFCFTGLLQNDKWHMPAYVHLDDQGRLLSIHSNPQEGISYDHVEGFAIPGIPNAHSHAFQYAMAGLTERHNTTVHPDDFWGWRKTMYELALKIEPEEMEAIAAMLYSEMLRHGYTHVIEFHYIHHNSGGQAYDNIAELGARLMAGAKSAGIKMTLVPILYQKGGFGKPFNPEQRRFISQDLHHYFQLIESSESAAKSFKDVNIAFGAHSMRAVDPDIIRELTEQIDKSVPFHMHVSEQIKEVEASMAYLNKRPVEWLAENVPMGENYHLVHATHITNSEVSLIAHSKATVVLCPSTEGNLGDGFFPLIPFQDNGGNWSIGTDSHIGLNPFEELRLLDYGQRLKSHQRNIYNSTAQADSGLFALNKIISSGRKATGNFENNFFGEGLPFDALILDGAIPILQVCSPNNLASTIVYASDVDMHLGTIVNGKWIVNRGKHINQEMIRAHFVNALKSLKNR